MSGLSWVGVTSRMTTDRGEPGERRRLRKSGDEVQVQMPGFRSESG